MGKLAVIGVSAVGLGTVSLLVWYYSKKTRKTRFRIEVEIPNTIVGSLIGRNGGSIKNIQNKSRAGIQFIASDVSSDCTRCIIKGDPNCVQLASGIIEDVVKNYSDKYENDGMSNILSDFEFQISDDHAALGNEYDDVDNGTALVKIDCTTSFIKEHTQKLCSSGGDGLIPVCVSGVAHPEKFWVQVNSTKNRAELDRLSQDMNKYYNSGPKFDPPISDVEVGYICAVCFIDDRYWYRAQVLSFMENDRGTLANLYLLDYGESVHETIRNIRPLSSKFLNVKFQAVECGLSNVKSKFNEWSTESITYFKDLVYVGAWYPLMARIDFDEYRPYITLFDTHADVDLSINEKLVTAGHALDLR